MPEVRADPAIVEPSVDARNGVPVITTTAIRVRGGAEHHKGTDDLCDIRDVQNGMEGGTTCQRVLTPSPPDIHIRGLVSIPAQGTPVHRLLAVGIKNCPAPTVFVAHLPSVHFRLKRHDQAR
jgi:hypothetical protein